MGYARPQAGKPVYLTNSSFNRAPELLVIMFAYPSV